MPVYRLSDEIVFPSPDLAREDGLLAVGGDLSEKRLLLAYSLGIFPWYSEGMPILWWSPDPRLLLVPSEMKVSRSLRQTLKKRTFRVTFDTAFKDVVKSCAAAPRPDDRGTWITDEMVEAYCRLHEDGFAHSVESWYGDQLAGGLYGVALGSAFFGESMFARQSDASKVALVRLGERLKSREAAFIDCQVVTAHLLSLGAREVPRKEFGRMLGRAREVPVPPGKWDTGEVGDG
jgi:leucyl/phenylalanyl-tRNA---protein transferase